jgi:hypothetical protein
VGGYAFGGGAVIVPLPTSCGKPFAGRDASSMLLELMVELHAKATIENFSFVFFRGVHLTTCTIDHVLILSKTS